MSLVALVITLIVIGVLLGLVNKYGPPLVDGKLLQIINIVVVIAVVLWLLNVFGVLGMGDITVAVWLLNVFSVLGMGDITVGRIC